MNLPIDREFVAQMVIVLAVCAGAWMMLVQPKQAELAHLQTQLAESGHASQLASEDGIQTLAAKCAAFKKRLQDVHRRNTVVDDTSSLYATIMRLANEHHVHVQAMQPTPPRDLGKQQAVRVARLEMTLSGPYEDVARFLDAVADIDAFIRPATLDLIPINDDQMRSVSARFGCEVLSFNIDTLLASGGEATDAQP